MWWVLMREIGSDQWEVLTVHGIMDEHEANFLAVSLRFSLASLGFEFQAEPSNA